MDGLPVQIDAHHAQDISEISILLPAPTIDSESNDSTEAVTTSLDDIPIHILMRKTGRSHAYYAIKFNINRHVKTRHKKEYVQWLLLLNHSNNKNQTKISSIFSTNNDRTKTVSLSRSRYHTTHPRQVQLSQAIVLNLIIDLSLSLSLVERQSFINFMNLIDPKFTMTSRRTLSRSIIPRLYNNMNDELKRFCDEGWHFNFENEVDDDEISSDIDPDAIGEEDVEMPVSFYLTDGLKQTSSIQPILSKVSKIAKLSHTSTIFAEKLEYIGKSIPKANKTRWNSQLDTIEKLLRIPETELNDILISIKRKDLCLLTKDYQILNKFSALLILFAGATTITQAEKTPSISFVAPTVLAIYYDLLNEQKNVLFTSHMYEALLSSLISRFGGLFEQLEIDIDRTIKQQKSSSMLYRDPIFFCHHFRWEIYITLDQ